ncbi:MAG: dipeptide ABC transporter ATP-binding protein [Deltaproteobacteria bacterium]|nr:dipeptide ABC transporter ATP-binding protein [Deltaproteobacteria bacterium]
MQTVLKTEKLSMSFPVYKGLIFRKEKARVQAVDEVSLDVKEGETLGLVGESGCGKSSFGRTVMRLYEPVSGRIELCGQDISRMGQKELLPHRRHFQMIFQDPYASLNPRMTVFDIIAEPFRTHERGLGTKELDQQVRSLMEMVGLSPRFVKKYPHEFSGGQRQRIAIARAIAVQPRLIICDEPVSALDVSVQAQIINLLRNLQQQLKLAYLFIAHDLAVVRHISDRVAVMYLGKIVEIADKEDIFTHPCHPYTKALLSAAPLADPDREKQRTRIVLEGDLPSPLNPPKGCVFQSRCPLADSGCTRQRPELNPVSSGHLVACHKVNSDSSQEQHNRAS